MRRCLFILLLTGVSLFAKADHITGGQMFYVYLGNSNGMHSYRVTLMLYMRCNSGREFPNPGFISVFERGSNQRVQDLQVSLTRQETTKHRAFIINLIWDVSISQTRLAVI